MGDEDQKQPEGEPEGEAEPVLSGDDFIAVIGVDPDCEEVAGGFVRIANLGKPDAVQPGKSLLVSGAYLASAGPARVQLANLRQE